MAGLALCAAPACAKSDPGRLDISFEHGPAGKTPKGWSVSAGTPGTKASFRISSTQPPSGHRSAVLTISGAGTPFGRAVKTLDATAFRGKTIAISAAMKVSGAAGTSATLWGMTQGTMRFRPNAGLHVEAGQGWKRFRLILPVSTDTKRIKLDLFQRGAGSTAIGDVKIRIADPIAMGMVPPHPISQTGLHNLHVFARLLGLVRFFHPSDQAAATDWDRFTIAAIPPIEAARGRTALIATLRALFAPIAPTLRIFATGHAVSAPTLLPPGAHPVVVEWRNQGVGLGDPAVTRMFGSKRIASAQIAMAPPFRADLGHGVSIIMPTTLYEDAAGTLPHLPKPKSPPTGKPPGFVPETLDRTTRLADVVLCWSVLDNFYPYLALEHVHWARALDPTLREAAMDRNDPQFARTLSKMIAALHDYHGAVYSVGQRYFSLPLWWDWIGGHLVITQILGGGQGLQIGDVVESIGGQTVPALVRKLTPTISAATRQSLFASMLYQLQKTTRRVPIEMAVRRDGATVRLRIQPGNFYPLPATFYGHKVVEEVRPGVWYVDLRRLSPSEFAAHLNDLAKARAIVFDVRGYPTDESFEVVRHLSSRPIHSERFDIPVRTAPTRNPTEYVHAGYALATEAPRFGGKIFFLTDGNAVSRSETILAMVKDNHLGLVVGSTTAGTNGNFNIIRLPGNYRIRWTGLRTRRYDGARSEGIGIKPDIPAHPTLAGFRAGKDQVLDAALRALH